MKKINSVCLLVLSAFIFTFTACKREDTNPDPDADMVEVSSADELLFKDASYDVETVYELTATVEDGKSHTVTNTAISLMTVSGDTCSITDKSVKLVCSSEEIYTAWKSLCVTVDEVTYSYDETNLTINGIYAKNSEEKKLDEVKAEFFPEGYSEETRKRVISDSYAKQLKDGSKLKYGYVQKDSSFNSNKHEWEDSTPQKIACTYVIKQ
jgi:hypothetical protein